MEYRQLGNSGVKVPVLSFGTATFGGSDDFYKSWGGMQAGEAARMIDLCIDAGVALFDTSNMYSNGMAEEILGKAIKGSRKKILLSTKTTFPISNGLGSSSIYLVKACEDSLRRLGTDHIDIYHLHGFDVNTPVEITLKALDSLVQSGKIRYIACSNFSGWQLMHALSVSERHGWSRYIAHQAYYSLLNRDFEWELMPLGIHQGIGTIVWSPLAAGKLSGKYRIDRMFPQNTRIPKGGNSVIPGPADWDRLYDIIRVLDELEIETGKSIAQIALNWLLQRPTVSTILLGARNEEQLKENLGASGWNLSLEQVNKLDKASEVLPAYPYWHHQYFSALNATPDLYSRYHRKN